MGPQGRGIANNFHVKTSDIDILMDTIIAFFGASGGCIVYSRRSSPQGASYAEGVSPAILTQIITIMRSITGVDATRLLPATRGVLKFKTPEMVQWPRRTFVSGSLPSWLSLPPELKDGSEDRMRLQQLAFKRHHPLAKLDFIVFGHDDSPIIPLLTFNPGEMPLFSRLMKERKNPYHDGDIPQHRPSRVECISA